VKSYTLTTPPAQEPLTTADAVTFLRSGGGEEEAALIASLISAAREVVENFTRRVLLESQWRVVCADWTGGEITWAGDVLTIDRSPLVSVQSVSYYALGSAVLTTLNQADYVVITGTTPGRVQLITEPPDLAERADAVQVAFTAGASLPTAIPPTLTHAVRLLVAHFYELRTPVNVGNIVNELPMSLQHLLTSQRIGGWSA
jgi:uncharacterized phiE125 gp8 family phage protein